MVTSRLVPYIKQQLEAGHDINSIRNYLIRNGYDQRDVNAAIEHIYKKPSKKIPIAAASVIGVVLIVILFFVFRGEDMPEQLLDLETSSRLNEIKPGEMLDFNVELINMGNAKRYDVSITHELIDLYGNTIATKQETLALETRSAKTSQILIPESASGTNTLKTTARYNGQKAISLFTINVKAEEEVIPPEIIEQVCPETCDDANACTSDYCGQETGFLCAHESITPCCGNNLCEDGEDPTICPADCKKVALPPTPAKETISNVVNQAKTLAGSNPNKAASYCESQERTNFKDSCHSAVADTAKDSSYCSPISSDTKRDSCYTTAALNGDFSVCEKLINKYLKQSCQSLAEASI